MTIKTHYCDKCELALDVNDMHRTSQNITLGEFELSGDTYFMVAAIAVMPRPSTGAGELTIAGTGAKARSAAKPMVFCRECIVKYLVQALNQFETPRIVMAQLANPND